MNLDEAIRITDPATRQEALYKYDPEERDSVEVEARHMAAQALREKQTGGWISVNDRLPKEPQEEFLDYAGYPEYIVMIENERTSTFLCYCGNGEWRDEYWILYRVTHWQPLPEPPKGE